ncbi:DUF3693 domain-containing protein [Stenotrophomonas maltophilia]|uniref:DUF3693 domain-containing protein n=1 Tax=Stenotrophomonas maltophilia TaxID=40324 RepID=UPI00313AAB7A
MNAIADLLDQARAGGNFNSDMGLATRLGVSRQTLHAWRKGTAPIPDERIAQISELGKLDGAVWMAKIHAERATSPVERRVWRSVLDRLSAAAAVLVLVVVAAPGVARAKAIDSQGFSGSDQPHSVYYVQSIPGDAGVPFASIPSRPGSYGFLHRSIRVLCMPQAIQPQTKPPPRDNDLFLFKGGSIQSLIGHESQRSQ